MSRTKNKTSNKPYLKPENYLQTGREFFCARTMKERCILRHFNVATSFARGKKVYDKKKETSYLCVLFHFGFLRKKLNMSHGQTAGIKTQKSSHFTGST